MTSERRFLEKGRCERLSFRDRSLKSRSRIAGFMGALTILLAPGHPTRSDEFDPLAVHQEARPLNDRWQACAALFVKGRLQGPRTPEALAEKALDHCRAQQAALDRFFVAKIGKRAAENVMMILRDKYRSDLTAAIEELRTRDKDRE